MAPHNMTGLLVIKISGRIEVASDIYNRHKATQKGREDVDVCSITFSHRVTSINATLDHVVNSRLLEWECRSSGFLIDHYKVEGQTGWSSVHLKEQYTSLVAGWFEASYRVNCATIHGSQSIRFSTNEVQIGGYGLKYKDFDYVYNLREHSKEFWLGEVCEAERPLLSALYEDLDFILANSSLLYLGKKQFLVVAGDLLLETILDTIETMHFYRRRQILCDQYELRKALCSPLRQPGVQF